MKSVLSPRALEVLQQLAALPEGHEDADILVDGRYCMFGCEPIHRKTFNALIRCGALSRAYDNGPYWVINETGRAIARRPALADEVFLTTMQGRGSFTIRDDRLVPLGA